MDYVRIITGITSLVIFFSIVELIRNNKLKEKYALLWLFAAVVMLPFSVSRGLLTKVSLFIGIKYPPSFIFLLAFFFLTVINIHYSTVISELYEKNKKLVQELTLLKQTIQGKNDFE